MRVVVGVLLPGGIVAVDVLVGETWFTPPGIAETAGSK